MSIEKLKESLGEDIFEVLKRELDNQPSSLPLEQIVSFDRTIWISLGFNWSESFMGYDFWSRISDKHNGQQ